MALSRFCIIVFLSAIALAGCAGAGTDEPAPSPALAATSTFGLLPSAAFTPAAPTAPPPTTSAETPQPSPTSLPPVPTAGATVLGGPTNPPAPPTLVVPPAGQVTLPPGFGISVFAGGLDTPRNIAIGPDGELYVAERGAGRIVRLPDRNHDGVSDGIQVVAEGFDTPSSLVFYKDGSIYVSTATQVFRLSQPDANGAFQTREVVIDGLSGPKDHFTRTLLFSPDWSSLFIQIGSSCNVCNESDPRRATIMRFNPDGSGGAVYARGLRNAVGITFRPGSNELWASNNGTDNLGDDQPPDTVQIVQAGQDYGWPRCHAGNIPDPQFGGPGACNGVAKPIIEIQAHSAALGLTFYSGTQFPPGYRGDLFVALHGSIYRSVPTGYRIVRIHFENGRPGPVQDFAAGWLLAGGRAWGRPVDVLTAPDGSLFVSDDSGGNIYRIFYRG